MCGNMADIQSPTLRLGEERKKEERRTNDRMKIYMVCLCPITRATINDAHIGQRTEYMYTPNKMYRQ